MARANWPKFFQEVRAKCDASPDGSVELTIDEIRNGAQSHDRQLDRHSWWARMMDPKDYSYKGVLENGMECEVVPEIDPVELVVFRLQKGANHVPAEQAPKTSAQPLPPRTIIVRGQDPPAALRQGRVIISNPPRVPHHETLLQIARKLIDASDPSVAIVVAHTACEVRVAIVLADAFRVKGLIYLEDVIMDRVQGYNLANSRLLKIYNVLTGDRIQDQRFWQAFTDSVKRRNEVVHDGKFFGAKDAEASFKVATEFINHLK